MLHQLSYGVDEAITPIDGRNKNKLTSLTPFLSDLALDKYRIMIEVEYLKKLSEYKVLKRFTESEKRALKKLHEDFGSTDYQEVRKIERETNHEMKAIEKFIQKRLAKTSLKDVAEMVHFGLTTDDVNNIAYALMIKQTLREVMIPHISLIQRLLHEKAKEYKNIAMLSRTHGQPAVPTTVGKEYLVFYKRLEEEMKILKRSEIKAKLTGNVGNLNAHKFLFPKINWLEFSTGFVSSFGLRPDLVTTQIEPYDGMIRVFQTLQRINNILLGLCVDFWLYISFGYFKQKVIQKEVGSTALPHKVNPIYFEGAEGGFGIANALFEFYSRKLSHSRLQRDLSDSTVRRSVGIALAYSLLSYQSVKEALERIEPDKERIRDELENHWEILSEAIQNFLRVRGYKDAYEKTKKLFRGKIMREKDVKKFIEDLTLSRKDKQILLDLKPENYTGYAKELVERFL